MLKAAIANIGEKITLLKLTHIHSWTWAVERVIFSTPTPERNTRVPLVARWSVSFDDKVHHHAVVLMSQIMAMHDGFTFVPCHKTRLSGAAVCHQSASLFWMSTVVLAEAR